MANRLRKARKPCFPLRSFEVLDSDGTNLGNAIAEEADRVLGKPGIPWIAGRSPGVPLKFGDVFRHLGHLPDFEATSEAIRVANEQGTTTEPRFNFLRDAWIRHPQDSNESSTELRGWLDSIGRSTFDAADEARELVELDRFLTALTSFSKGQSFALPSHLWAEVSAWRVLLPVFPESLGMFRMLLTDRGSSWTRAQRRAGLYIVAASSHNCDQTVRTRCEELVNAYENRCSQALANNLDEYLMIRAIRFAKAQVSGSAADLNRTHDLINRYKRSDWEQTLHRQYYGGDDSQSLRAIAAVIRSDKPRSVVTRPITEQIYYDVFRAAG